MKFPPHRRTKKAHIDTGDTAMTEPVQKPQGLSFIAKLILGKLVLLVIVGVVVYWSLRRI